MNTFVKCAASFIFGVGIGFGGTMLFYNRRCKKLYEELLEADIADMKKYYEDKYGEKLPEKEDAKEEEDPNQILSPEHYMNKGPAEQSITRDYVFPKGQKIDYAAKYAGSEHPMDSDEDEGFNEELRERELRKNKGPKPIKKEEFGQIAYYDTYDLLYHTSTGAFENANLNEPIEELDLDEIESMLGNALIKYGFTEDDEQEELYVRNVERACDYHISKVFDD